MGKATCGEASVKTASLPLGAIALACTSSGLQRPAGLRVHSTKGLATLWVLFMGLSIQDVYAAA